MYTKGNMSMEQDYDDEGYMGENDARHSENIEKRLVEINWNSVADVVYTIEKYINVEKNTLMYVECWIALLWETVNLFSKYMIKRGISPSLNEICQNMAQIVQDMVNSDAFLKIEVCLKDRFQLEELLRSVESHKPAKMHDDNTL
jgi:inhibitor of KinA sporulation pathway (predicted exonuclease)